MTSSSRSMSPILTPILTPMETRLLAALILLAFTLVMAKSMSAGPAVASHRGDQLLASPYRR